MKFFFLSMLLSWVAAPAMAGSYGTSLSLGEVRAIANRPEVTNVDEFIAALPPEYLRNFTMMVESQSLQPATAGHPRLILFGADARTILAFTTDPDDPDRERIEMMSVNSVGGGWDFARIDLSEENPELDLHPPVCGSCHGTANGENRPIWGTYPEWPGSIMSSDGGMSDDQAQLLNSIIATAPESDRFRHLEFDRDEYIPLGSTFSMPGRLYPFTNIAFQFELARASSEATYLRVRDHAKIDLATATFLAAVCADQPLLDLAGRVVGRDGAESTRTAWSLVGVDEEEFQLHQFAFETPGASTWSSGESTLEYFLAFRLLWDVAQANPDMAAALQAIDAPRASAPSIPSVGYTAPNLLAAGHLMWSYGMEPHGEATQLFRGIIPDLNWSRVRGSFIDPGFPAFCPWARGVLEAAVATE